MKKSNSNIKFVSSEREISAIVKGYGIAATAVLVLFFGAALWQWREYRDALSFIESRLNLLNDSDNSPVVRIFPAPLEIKHGRALAKESLLKHLRDIGYAEEQSGEKPGSFWFDETNETLQIISRFAEFPSLKIKFRRAKISSVENKTTHGKLQTAELEPLLLGNYLVGENPKEIGAVIHQKVSFEKDLKGTNFLDALIVVEDKGFFEQENGIAWRGIGRALWERIKCPAKKIIGERCKKSGGSSITQQLVKNLFLTPEQTLSRKRQEFWLTLALEKYLNSKERILE
ncbi:MAG: transglycosylase domain-containing protein, partial [Acidobacteria bacterium]|nr:transglycosylase domain-containing protein [Acidobacteriota bacterium]